MLLLLLALLTFNSLISLITLISSKTPRGLHTGWVRPSVGRRRRTGWRSRYPQVDWPLFIVGTPLLAEWSLYTTNLLDEEMIIDRIKGLKTILLANIPLIFPFLIPKTFNYLKFTSFKVTLILLNRCPGFFKKV